MEVAEEENFRQEISYYHLGMNTATLWAHVLRLMRSLLGALPMLLFNLFAVRIAEDYVVNTATSKLEVHLVHNSA